MHCSAGRVAAPRWQIVWEVTTMLHCCLLNKTVGSLTHHWQWCARGANDKRGRIFASGAGPDESVPGKRGLAGWRLWLWAADN